MSNWNLERELTRCYLVLWGLWIGYLTLRVFAMPIFVGWPSKAAFFALSGLVIPGLLLLACRWAGRGFRVENNTQ